MVWLGSMLRRGALAAFLALWATSAFAVSMIRDADIEHALKELARPLITAAGLSPSRIRIIVLNDPELNAFVVDGTHVFINSGLLLRLGTSAELQAVIAHELAHIANGHIVTRTTNANQMRSTAGVGFLLAFATALAGGGDAASGIAFGVSGSATGVFLGHTRAEEASADASSVRYMARAHVDPRAAMDVFEIFRGQEALSARQQDAYMRSHPLTADRIRSIGAAAAGVEAYPLSKKANYWFQRTRAKLSAYLVNPSTTFRKYKKSDKSDIAHMARAVAYHRTPDPEKALAEIKNALAKRPNDAFYYDLKGQILLESRAFSASVTAYETADGLNPNHPQILAGLGRAYLSLKTSAGDRKALKTLQAAYARDASDARMLRDLALAFARLDQNAMASLATAERYAMLGRTKDAILHATRAEKGLSEGSTAWRRARDLIHAAKLAEKTKDN